MVKTQTSSHSFQLMVEQTHLDHRWKINSVSGFFNISPDTELQVKISRQNERISEKREPGVPNMDH